MDIIHKSFPVEVTKVDSELGQVTAIVAVMGNIDHGDDIIHNGAFTKTLSERGMKIKVLDNHNSHSNTDVIGKPLSMREIPKSMLPDSIKQKYPDASGGLETVTQFDMKDQKAVTIFNKIADGFIDEWSIGFSLVQGKYDHTPVKTNGRDKIIRNIREVKLYEYSPVIWAMNDATTTTATKMFTPLNDEKQRSILQTWYEIVEAFEAIYLDKEFWAGYYVNDIFDDGTMVVKPCNIEATYPYYRLNWSKDADNTYAFSSIENWQGGNYTFVAGLKSDETEQETKQGRVLNQGNYDKLKQASELLSSVLDSAAVEPTDDMNEDIEAENKSEVKTQDALTSEQREKALIELNRLLFNSIHEVKSNA